MTNEEAIKHLHDDWYEMFDHSVCVDFEDKDDFLEAIGVAITTLRKNATLNRSKWNGCDYCNDPHPCADCVLPDGTERIICSNGISLFRDCFINERKIDFCPYCGRPLTESAWKEMEMKINNG